MADDKGPVPVASTALIKVGGTNFLSMNDSSAIDSMKASAPAFHQSMDYALKVSGTVRGEDPVVQRAQYRERQLKQVFRTGSPVIHIETGKKLTVIHASVGHTRKTNTPVHRVADKNGNVWDIKESKLKLRV